MEPEAERLDRPAICPHCGHENDCATDTLDSGERPGPGDLSICASCGELGMFFTEEGGLGVRKLTESEMFSVQMSSSGDMVRRASVLIKLKNKTGVMPRAIIAAEIDEDGNPRPLGLIPPEFLDPFF